MNVQIRKLNINDWHTVSIIYKQGIDTGNATFEKHVPSWVEWDRSHLSVCRLVAESGKEVIGWAALSHVSDREAYKGVAEVSLYVSESHAKKGVGKKLLMQLIEESENKGIWTLQSQIFPKNTASLRLHKSCGFRKVGYREKIGKMDDKWRDTVLLERRSHVTGV